METFKVKVGADPEILLLDASGKLESAWGKIPGTKKDPLLLGGGFAVQSDGVAGEFNIPEADSFDEFERAIVTGVTNVHQFAAKFGLRISKICSGNFKFSSSEEAELGCDPDFNAWQHGAPNFVFLEDESFRCAGGHVHIGIGSLPDEELHQLVKVLDFRLTLKYLEQDDPIRRKLYGKAGAFRKKSYGVEYRTLGNFWIFDKNSDLRCN